MRARMRTPPTPMFFVSVASKRLRYCASPLFATHTRGSRSVASKGLTLHQNCAENAHFRLREWVPASPRSARKRCAKVLRKELRGVERQVKGRTYLGEGSFPTRSKPSR